MTLRSLLLATALFAAGALPGFAQSDDLLPAPVLRAHVTVAGDLVRIGDVIDHAGSAAQIAIYRAPDLGTTGSLPTASVLAALRAHQVVGVDTRNIGAVSVTRRARTLDGHEIEQQVAAALERRSGLGDAADLTLTFDRPLQTLHFDAALSGALRPIAVRYEPRAGRFDVTFEIAGDGNAAPTRLRYTGTAVESVETAVLVRSVERHEIVKSSDVVIERRPKAEVGGEPASREAAIGMQARRQLRAGQPLRSADLAKPDLVQRDQSVTLIYETPGLYLTVRGKALEGGTEGDVVNVMNLQSKRSVAGTVVGRGQVAIVVAAPRVMAAATAVAPIAVAAGPQTASASPKAE